MFLAGHHAWKLKRAVRYDYFDFSSAERRKAMCEAEVRVNRRTAAAIYPGVVAVTREHDGALALGGSGVAVDWLVAMARFDQEGLLDRLAARASLDLALMGPLATSIAQFHLAAERRRDHGGKRGMPWMVDGDAAAFDEDASGVLDLALHSGVTRDARGALDQHGGLLDARRDAGMSASATGTCICATSCSSMASQHSSTRSSSTTGRVYRRDLRRGVPPHGSLAAPVAAPRECCLERPSTPRARPKRSCRRPWRSFASNAPDHSHLIVRAHKRDFKPRGE